MGGFIPLYDGQPKILENGLPDMRVACMPREQITFTDGWFVMGLQGTGSYDYECADVFVPEGWTYPLFTKRAQARRRPLQHGDLSRHGVRATPPGPWASPGAPSTRSTGCPARSPAWE